jgi:hypothetical protein
MKNIISFNNRVKCSSCCVNGFFCYAPEGEMYKTCPLCQNDDYISELYEDNRTHYNQLFSEENNSDIYQKYDFCAKCKIIFVVGCKHASSNCYNGHLISKWQYDGEEYIGMPQFASIDEWYNELKNIKILEWICPNNGLLCCKESFTDPPLCSLQNKN